MSHVLGRIEAGTEGPLRRALGSVVLPLIPGVLFAGAWQLYATITNSFVFPTFTSFVQALWELILSVDLWESILVSNEALVIGFVASVVIGVPLGIVLGRAPQLRNIVDPYLNIALVTPLIVVVPIILIAFGITLTARSIVVFIFAVPFVVIPTLTGVRGLEVQWIEMCRCYGASRLAIWREVVWPGAMPSIASGLRQGFAHGITGMIIVELTLMAVGVGILLQTYSAALRYDQVFAVVFVLMVEAVLGVSALTAVEKRMSRA